MQSACMSRVDILFLLIYACYLSVAMVLDGLFPRISSAIIELNNFQLVDYSQVIGR